MGLQSTGSGMADYSNLVRPIITEVCGLPKTGTRGKAIGDKALDDVIYNMGFNENVLGPSPKAMAAMAATLDKSYCYPDDSYVSLRKALSKRHDVPQDMVHVTNGGSEFLYLIGRLFMGEGDETIIAKPTFMLYSDIAMQMKAVIVEVPGENHEHDLLKMAEAITDKTKVIWVSNPSNPSGTYNKAEEVDKFVHLVDDRCLIVFDEAYGDFVESNDFPRTINYLLEGRKVCIMHTFSKNFGLAGLRVGYGLANPELLKYLPAVRIRFTVSTTAQNAALAALDDQEYIERSKRFVKDAREFYYRELDRLGLEYVPTQTNFILFDTGKDSMAVSDALKRKGFLIRPGWIFGLDSHIRVTFGDIETNKLLIKALEEVLKELS